MALDDFGLTLGYAPTRYRVVNTWNGGKLGRKVEFESTKTGDGGHNQCFEWIHRNTIFSFDEATRRQGYVVEHIIEDQYHG